jgi:hypothetical protein
MSKRLSAWMRIWIVISGAWLIGASIYAWRDGVDNKIQAQLVSQQLCAAGMGLQLSLDFLNAVMPSSKDSSAAKEPDGAPKKDFKTCDADIGRGFESTHWWSWVDWPIILLLALVPLPLFWLVVFGPIRWIARGFARP